MCSAVHSIGGKGFQAFSVNWLLSYVKLGELPPVPVFCYRSIDRKFKFRAPEKIGRHSGT